MSPLLRVDVVLRVTDPPHRYMTLPQIGKNVDSPNIGGHNISLTLAPKELSKAIVSCCGLPRTYMLAGDQLDNVSFPLLIP